MDAFPNLWNRGSSSVKEDEEQSPDGLADSELVRRFCETGEAECFAELFRRHRLQIYSACRAFLGDSGAAEDAAQETFVRAYRHITHFTEGNLPGWLARIAKNVCIDEWRKRQFETGAEEIEICGSSRREPLSFDSLTGLRFAAQRVRDEMAALPIEQRQCLEMKIQGYSYEETAARTGMAVGAVKSHLQNGRRTLWLRMRDMLAQLR